MIFTWVIGQYSPSTEVGKGVIAHANAGIGYYELNKTRSKGENIVVGFKWVNHKEPIPRHLVVANTNQVEILEKMEDKRNGMERKTNSSASYNVAAVFPAKEVVTV